TKRQRELLSQEDGDALDRHLGDCAACRVAEEGLQETRELLRRAEPALGASTAPALRLDLEALLNRPAGQPALPAWGGGALAVTAALALCLALALRAGRPHRSTGLAPAVAAHDFRPTVGPNRQAHVSEWGNGGMGAREGEAPSEPLAHSPIPPFSHSSTPPLV